MFTVWSKLFKYLNLSRWLFLQSAILCFIVEKLWQQQAEWWLSHLNASLYLTVLVHNGKYGLHAAVLHQIRLVPHQDQGNPENVNTTKQID